MYYTEYMQYIHSSVKYTCMFYFEIRFIFLHLGIELQILISLALCNKRNLLS